MLLLNAKPLLAEMKSTLSLAAERFLKETGRKPKLAVVLVGKDPASVIYTTNKAKACENHGLSHVTITFEGDAKAVEVQSRIEQLNCDPEVDGILIQRPLPLEFIEEEVSTWISPEKDVDAFHPLLAGKLFLGMSALTPCTPQGIIRLLDHYQIPIQGKLACVVGRSSIVGKPIASLLLQRNATVIQTHRHTHPLSQLTQQADLLVVAAGKRDLIRAEHVKPGAVVVDVGIHRDAQGKVSGDVHFDSVSRVASALTPVPGGVGPLTIAMLLENTLRSAYAREHLSFVPTGVKN